MATNLVVLSPCWNQTKPGKPASYSTALLTLHNNRAKEARVSLIRIVVGYVNSDVSLDPVGVFCGAELGTHWKLELVMGLLHAQAFR